MDRYYLARANFMSRLEIARSGFGDVVVASDETGTNLGRVILSSDGFAVIEPEKLTTFTVGDGGVLEEIRSLDPRNATAASISRPEREYHTGIKAETVEFLLLASSRLQYARGIEVSHQE